MADEFAPGSDDSVASRREERRHHDRSRLIVDVLFDGKDATGIASTKDMSAGGLYMNTQADLPEGAILSLRIPFGVDQIVVEAEVVYTNPRRGVGVRFRNLSASDEAILARELLR